MAYKLEVCAHELGERFAYLDELRASGRTNMFGAAAFLEAELDLSHADAKHTLKAWMATYSPDKSPEQRAAERLNSEAA